MELKNKVVDNKSTNNDLETEIKYLRYDVIALKRLVKELFMVNEKLGVQIEAGSTKGMFKFYFFNANGDELEHYNYFVRSKAKKAEEPAKKELSAEEVEKLDDEALTDYIANEAVKKAAK